MFFLNLLDTFIKFKISGSIQELVCVNNVTLTLLRIY